MADVPVVVDQVTVIGGPSKVDVQLDFGPAGMRGSYIYAVNGNPNSVTIGQTPNINDWCININKEDTEYSYMYQYVAIPNGSPDKQWKPVLKVNPAIYSANYTTVFTNGEAQINVNISNIAKLTTTQNLTSASFNIQYQVLGSNPVASSMTVQNLIASGTDVALPIILKGVEYSAGEWSDLDGSKTVHLLITVV